MWLIIVAVITFLPDEWFDIKGGNNIASIPD